MRSATRILASVLAMFAVVAGVSLPARLVAPNPFAWWGFLVSVLGAVVAFVVMASLYEWLVHRYLYHGPSRVRLLYNVYQIHERGHHGRRFPPNRYVQQGPVNRIPVLPADPDSVCESRGRRWTAWWGQFLLYLAVAVPFAFAPAWLFTRNLLFTVSMIVSGLVVSYLLIRVHDVIHYPAHRLMERQAWFQFLDRHHYIHHIDTSANLNFLLPLCDLLFGTLRLELTPEEGRRWPSFEEAKRLEKRVGGSRSHPFGASPAVSETRLSTRITREALGSAVHNN